MSDATIAVIAGVISSIVAVVMVAVGALSYIAKKRADVRVSQSEKETAVSTKLTLNNSLEVKRTIDRLYLDNQDLRARLDKSDAKVDAQATKYDSLFQLYVDLRADNQIMRRELDAAHAEIAELQDYRTYAGILQVQLRQHDILYPPFEDVKKK